MNKKTMVNGNGVVKQIDNRIDDLKDHISDILKPIKETQDAQQNQINKNTKFRHYSVAIGTFAISIWALVKKFLGGN